MISRVPLHELGAVQQVELDVLSAVDAVAVLRTLVGSRVDDEPDAAAALAEECARLPLALTVAAGVAATRADAQIADLVAQLTGGQWVPAGAGTPSTVVQSVATWSYRCLPAEASRAFRLLGTHPGPDFDAFGLAALTGNSVEEARRLSALLAAARLVRPAESAGRYVMPTLIHDYAADLARTEDSEEDHRTALRRLLDHYVATSAAAFDTLSGGQRSRRSADPPRTPEQGSAMPPMAEPAAAVAWLEAERPALRPRRPTRPLRAGRSTPWTWPSPRSATSVPGPTRAAGSDGDRRAARPGG